MKKLLRIWVYSNFHIATIAFLFSLETNYILGIESDLKSPLFVFFSTIFIYNLGYYQAILFKKPPQRYHAEWMVKHIAYWGFSMLISLIVILYLYSSYSFDAQKIIVILSFISFIYIIHTIKLGKWNLSIRNIPYIKTIIVSVVWALITVLPQVIDHELLSLTNSWFPLIIERVLFVLPIALMFDIRDMESDPESFSTIPRLIGIRMTKVIALISLIGAFYFFLQIPVDINPLLLLPVYILMLFSILYSSPKREELYYSAWFDSLIALHAIVIIFIMR